MDRVSQVLAQGVPPGVPYRALADHGHGSRSALHYRNRGQRLIGEKAKA